MTVGQRLRTEIRDVERFYGGLSWEEAQEVPILLSPF